MDELPAPEELWRRYCAWKKLTPASEAIVAQDYYVETAGKSPRYYQASAINRVVEAVAKGQDRMLLVMATGTGKTYTAFQIIWRLWKAKAVTRVLFLADRNILVDQTRTNDLKPFGGKMTKITNRKADKSYGIYPALSSSEKDKDLPPQRLTHWKLRLDSGGLCSPEVRWTGARRRRVTEGLPQALARRPVLLITGSYKRSS
jgi:type I restriction enzyme R subunit